eukprot:9172241-Alexandrium_andersonii.AAC.1
MPHPRLLPVASQRAMDQPYSAPMPCRSVKPQRCKYEAAALWRSCMRAWQHNVRMACENWA